MRVLGYVRGPKRDGLDCQQPLRVVCRNCDHGEQWACQGHRESRCRPCAGRYRRRVRALAESGTRRSRGGFLYLLTLTAPGDTAHKCRCTPAGGVDLAAWNTAHSRYWNRFRTRVSKEYQGLEFFRGVEVQDRGALHDHSMVWSPRPLLESWVREVAMDAGYGHQVDLSAVEPGSRRAARYVAKYVTKAVDLRAQVPWLAEVVDSRTGEVTVAEVPGRYRTWSMSRHWGGTMAGVRAAAAVYALSKRALCPDEMPRAVPGPEPADAGELPGPSG